MNKVYPYYEIKEKINLLVDDLDTIMLKEGWTFESKECNKTDLIYNKELRKSDERFFYTTTNGKKIVNNDYLFVGKLVKGKNMKHLYKKIRKYGFDITENGLITNIKKNDTNASMDSSICGDNQIL
jgi:hypothetical protein